MQVVSVFSLGWCEEGACCFVWTENELDLVCVHVCISCRYNLMFAFVMFLSLCVDVMVMS